MLIYVKSLTIMYRLINFIHKYIFNSGNYSVENLIYGFIIIMVLLIILFSKLI